MPGTVHNTEVVHSKMIRTLLFRPKTMANHPTTIVFLALSEHLRILVILSRKGKLEILIECLDDNRKRYTKILLERMIY